MNNEVLCKFLCHNICVVNQWQIDLGIAANFWAPDAVGATPDAPVVLPFGRPG